MKRTWLLVAVLACGGKKDDAPPPPEAKPTPVQIAPAPATAARDVQVFVNDAPVGRVDAAAIAKWPRLDALVPSDVRKIGTWQSVKLASAKNETIDKPSDNYRDMVPALFPGDGGAPAFGMFDPVELAKHGTPAAGSRGDQVREVRLVVQANGRGGNEDNAAADADPTKLVIEIKTPAGASQLTGDQLLAIPREQQPDGGGAKGWTLATVLAAAGIKKFEKLALADTAGTVLPIEKADLSATSVPFVKLNKQGQLRVKVYKKQGEGWVSGGDLRSMASISVIK